MAYYCLQQRLDQELYPAKVCGFEYKIKFRISGISLQVDKSNKLYVGLIKNYFYFRFPAIMKK